MNELFVAMRTVHGSDAGEPPIWSNDIGGKYIGYFEKFIGEEWEFDSDLSPKQFPKTRSERISRVF